MIPLVHRRGYYSLDRSLCIWRDVLPSRIDHDYRFKMNNSKVGMANFEIFI